MNLLALQSKKMKKYFILSGMVVYFFNKCSGILSRAVAGTGKHGF